MQPKAPKLLEDVRDAAAFIGEAVRGKGLHDYERERLLRQAIERNFEIIGEAMNRLEHRSSAALRVLSWHARMRGTSKMPPPRLDPKAKGRA